MVIAKFLCCSVEEFRTPFYSKSVEIDDEERYLLGKDIMMILAFQKDHSLSSLRSNSIWPKLRQAKIKTNLYL
jgi:hypothetical protein